MYVTRSTASRGLGCQLDSPPLEIFPLPSLLRPTGTSGATVAQDHCLKHFLLGVMSLRWGMRPPVYSTRALPLRKRPVEALCWIGPPHYRPYMYPRVS
jgi:hypothetical protein